MLWKITRTLGPGIHYLGPDAVVFDMNGVGWTEHIDAAAQAACFPKMFRIEATESKESFAEKTDVLSFPVLSTWTEDILGDLTIGHLLKIADAFGLCPSRSIRKAALIELLLTHQVTTALPQVD